MGLFDQEEESPAESVGGGAAVFDEESKIRLFETQQRESAGGWDYLKKFLPVAAVAILLVAGAIWYMQPGVGSAVKPSRQVEDAVYDYMLKNEHRSVREITFYNCGDWYWIRILAEPTGAVQVADHPANQYRLRVDRNPADDTVSGIRTLPLTARKEDDKPCTGG
jgi:hypothetical protein